MGEYGERDEQFRNWQRAEETWSGTRGNGQNLTRGEFYARWDPTKKQIDYLYDRIEDLENRLLTERAKDWGSDMLASLWGKLVLLVFVTASAYIGSRFAFDVHSSAGDLLPW